MSGVKGQQKKCREPSPPPQQQTQDSCAPEPVQCQAPPKCPSPQACVPEPVCEQKAPAQPACVPEPVCEQKAPSQADMCSQSYQKQDNVGVKK
ncbi:small proline-rich protein 2D-like isoform X2 [Eleutherodactylus coqui]|uniref:small proline-rich protein 2D-like isoform X2 n=1 Tax=Eleutherodactylus coqui TaxID=57060 RepID=UPI003461AEF5